MACRGYSLSLSTNLHSYIVVVTLSLPSPNPLVPVGCWRFDASLGPLGTSILDAAVSKTPQTAILLPFFFQSFFRCRFGSILARFSTPTCLPKFTKIAQKSMPRCLPMLNSFFDRFLIDFCSQLEPLEPNLALAG